jgi:mutator protein MutT
VDGARRFRPGGAQVIPRPHAWSIVESPPPAGHPLRVSTDAVVDAVRSSRSSRPALYDGDDARQSAVLVALADDDSGDAGVLLTRRSRHLRSHSGEMSFPGGRIDAGESAEQAALREAYEEVGLDPTEVELVGTLDHLATVVSRSYIIPVVGRLPAQPELQPASPNEVERVMWVPLRELVRPDTYRVERWGEPPNSRLLYFYELDDETVWGATGSMLGDLLRRLA